MQSDSFPTVPKGRPPRFESLADSLWSRLPTPEGCWPWPGKQHDKDGYPLLKFKGRRYRCHRVAYELANGPIPPGLFVLHRCDNPRCCRPDHLFLGTQAENVADMVAKGRNASGDANGSRLHPERLARGDRSGARLHPERLARGDRNAARAHPERMPRGSRHGMAKLTEDQVRAIRRQRALGLSIASIARTYDVAENTIALIVTGQTWRHVE